MFILSVFFFILGMALLIDTPANRTTKYAWLIGLLCLLGSFVTCGVSSIK
jgi:hypothetical protein